MKKYKGMEEATATVSEIQLFWSVYSLSNDFKVLMLVVKDF